MKTKLQLSKNVTMNKPDEKRRGMKVRTVVTGHDAKGRAVFPPVGGIRFIIGTYSPGDFIAPEPTPEMHLEDGDELGGANAGFHRTDTTDFGVVLSGNLALQL